MTKTWPSGRPPQAKRFDHLRANKNLRPAVARTGDHRPSPLPPSVSSTPTTHPITSSSSSSTPPFPRFSPPPIAAKTQSTGSDVTKQKDRWRDETRKKERSREKRRKGEVETKKLVFSPLEAEVASSAAVRERERPVACPTVDSISSPPEVLMPESCFSG